MTFQVTVDDGNDSSTDTVDITVNDLGGNNPPIADAGLDQNVVEGTVGVMLDGTGSSDPDSDPITYSWVQTLGTTVTLVNPTTAQPTFTAPAATQTLTFELTVDDGTDSSTDTVDIIVNTVPVNNPPIANAGIDQTVNEGDAVTLDASGSLDLDSDPITYSWVQTFGTTVTLSDPVAIQPTFTAPAATQTLTFELTVDDGTDSSTDTVDIIVNTVPVNNPPIANAGIDQTVNEGDAVTLDASGSLDLDSDPITYSWVQTLGTAVTLSDPTLDRPTFTALPVGSAGETLTFEVTVTDGTDSSTDTVDIIVNDVPNNAPVANDQGVSVDEDGSVVITLTGSDIDLDTLTFATVTNPIEGAITNFDVNAGTLTYTPNANYYGTDSFTFTVNDGMVDSTEATVSITVNQLLDDCYPIGGDIFCY